MRYAACNEMFRNWPLDRTCAACATAGCSGIELAPFTFAPEGVDHLDAGARGRIRHAVVAAGLEVVGLHWLLVGPAGLGLTVEDAAVRARTSNYLCALVDCCADLGGRVLVLGSPHQRNLPAGVAEAEGMRRAAAALAPAVRRAEASGVRWCLEPLPASETNFLHTLDSCLTLADLLGGGSAVGVQLDVKSLCAEAGDPAAAIRNHAAVSARFGHLHLQGRDGGPPDDSVPWRELWATLTEVGYDGWASLEVFTPTDDPAAMVKAAVGRLVAAAAPMA